MGASGSPAIRGARILPYPYGIEGRSRGRYLSRRRDRQKLLEESTDLPSPVHELELQAPVACIAVFVRLAKELLIAGADREPFGVGRRALVREVADEVPRRGRAELPTGS